MPLPTYQIEVLSPVDGSVVAIFDSTAIYDLHYSRALNDIGVLALTLPSTDVTRAAFVLDSFIEVYRTSAAGVLRKEETYLCRLTHRFIEGDEERFVVGGVSLNHLLARRIIDPDDDPLAAGGYSTKSGAADQVMYDYCNEQIGPAASLVRQMFALVLAPVTGIGLAVGYRLRHENLFEQMQLMAKAGCVDFWIDRYQLTNAMRLNIGAFGIDRSYAHCFPLGLPYMTLSPIRGNLANPSWQLDRQEEGNFVYELGQGRGETRLVLKQAGTGVADSPYNRCEYKDDARNVEKSDVPGLITSATTSLADKRPKREFTYQALDLAKGSRYRDDWDLGDAALVIWGTTNEDARFIKIEIAISSEGETITATMQHYTCFPGS